MIPRVELLYDSECPNVEAAREALRKGLVEAGLALSYTEWDLKSEDCPPYARQFGSPTILVNGRDVADSQPAASDCCRVYDSGAGGLRGVPPVSLIAAAFGKAGALPVGQTRSGGRSGWCLMASLPGIGAALLPIGFCPACWPAYAGVLASVGFGFLLYPAYLFPIASVLLGLGLLALAFRARNRWGYAPFFLGLVSSGGLLFFKFAHPMSWPAYAGFLGFLVASLWNVWPKRKDKSAGCPSCKPGKRTPIHPGTP